MKQSKDEFVILLEKIACQAHAIVHHPLLKAYFAGYSDGFKECERIEKQKEVISADLLKFATADSLDDAFPDLPGDDVEPDRFLHEGDDIVLEEDV